MHTCIRAGAIGAVLAALSCGPNGEVGDDRAASVVLELRTAGSRTAFMPDGLSDPRSLDEGDAGQPVAA